MDIRRKRFLDYGLKIVSRSLDSIEKLKRFSERSNYIVDSTELRGIVDQLKDKVTELENYYFANELEPKVFTLKTVESSLDETKWKHWQEKTEQAILKLQEENSHLGKEHIRIFEENLLIFGRLNFLDKAITKNNGKG
jgi:hypothetical protein